MRLFSDSYCGKSWLNQVAAVTRLEKSFFRGALRNPACRLLLESFTPCCCPHQVARRLKIDAAPAVVGFEYHSGGAHPVYDGVIVCQENAEVSRVECNRVSRMQSIPVTWN